MTDASSQKVALVTGANKGIGFEIARQLGKLGITVFLGARDQERGEAAEKTLKDEGLDARFIQIDVGDPQTIEGAVKRIESECSRLDILVNNAGIYIDNEPPSGVEMSRVRATFEINVFGVIAMTQAFLPLIQKSDAGRIVNMSSGLGSIAQHSDPESPMRAFNALAYNSSKSCVNAVTVQFANELASTSIKVNAADPGYVATDLNNNTGFRTVEQGAAEPVRLATLPDDGPTGGYFSDDGPVPW
jgi:NAD(P)-dependent dehydrogenase (short-subunit alcohol dehydrogenase family)